MTKKRIALLLALAFSMLIAVIGTAGIGTTPPIGSTFNPGTGVWSVIRTAQLPTNSELVIKGLNAPVTVTFDKQGTPYIYAQSDHDLFMAIGYLQATFRLFEMDLLRREASGGLTQILGPTATPTDELELTLGLNRTAQTEWSDYRSESPVQSELLAFSAGVNDRIVQDVRSGNLPFEFKLLNYRPAPWTPVDTLLVQGDLTQSLDFTTTPIDYSLLTQSIGYNATMKLFPIEFPNVQHPYDPGPYLKLAPAQIPSRIPGTVPIPVSGNPSVPLFVRAASAVQKREVPVTTSVSGTTAVVGKGMRTAIDSVESWLRSTLPSLIRIGSASNNFAVAGSRTVTHRALLEGDPHLVQTLPSIWYQISANSPDLQISGVSVPGIPGILIGRNRHIAWSLTDSQNQSTLFYKETTSRSRPGEYLWHGHWYRMRVYRYRIAQKGGGYLEYSVKVTVHGPLLTSNGATLAVDWMGALPSDDLGAALAVWKASTFSEFKRALAGWLAPTQNFIYADDAGNIGIISAGIYPIVRSGRPWLPLAGTGASDVIGAIAYAANPQAYNPSDHFLFSANQRPVAANYPYYIGTTADYFSTGYRASTIFDFLRSHHAMSVADAEALQNSVTDHLATKMVPKLLEAVRAEVPPGVGALNEYVFQSVNLLSKWNYDMSVNSAAATIWWTFWQNYLDETFGPLWAASKVPTRLDPNLIIQPSLTPLDVVLEQATWSHPNSSIFTPPNGQVRSANAVMFTAFLKSIAQLRTQMGGLPETWRWGRIHFRQFQSLTLVDKLGYGPRPASGDIWTVNAADGSLVSHAGPSWRMIVNFGGGSYSVYPGGQSENPVSGWYETGVQNWWNGSYFRFSRSVRPDDTFATWTLLP